MSVLTDVVISRVTDQGFGVADLNGRSVYVDRTYTGEKVRVRIIGEHPTYYNAHLVEVLEASPFRIEPECCYSSCGGCAFNFIDSKELLKLKNEFLLSCLKEQCVKFDCILPECSGMYDFHGYRNKAIYYVRAQNGKFVIGFFSKNSHDVVEIYGCIMEPDFVSCANEIIAKWAEDFNIHAFDESTGRGLIKNIIYRSGEGTGERMLVVVATDFKIPNLDELMLRLEPLKFTSVWICRNKSQGNSIWTDELKKISGKEHIYTCLAGLKYEISARSFLQLNIKQCEKLYGLVLEFADVKSSDVVFDLYCGIGTITLKLAQKARKVYGIEIVPEAVKNAVRNAELNDLRNVEFIEGKSETVCEELVNKKQIRADIVVVDPPRKGCDSSLINTLIFLNPEKIVYVSCNPKTLARDLKLLESDYKITKIATVDMFPNTLHVESVVKLTRAGV